jgi:tripartite ATP-independent transporter DctP family solute receptor
MGHPFTGRYPFPAGTGYAEHKVITVETTMRLSLNPVLRGIFTAGLAFVMTAASAQTTQPRNIRIAVNTAVDHPLTAGAQKFADLVNEKSGGKLRARVYPSGTLGNDVQVIGSLQGGTIDAGVPTAGLVTSLAKEYNLFLLPGAFRNPDEADAMSSGPFMKKVSESLAQHKLIVLAHMEHGFKHVTNNKRSINKWEDLDGLKIRVAQSPVLLDTFKTLGVNPIPMPYSEVYTAAEQGAIDGLENTLVTIHSAKFYEVQKYISLTGHMYDMLLLVFSKPTWDKLSPEEKKILTDSAEGARVYQRQFNRELEKKVLVDIRKHGVVVNEMSEPERARMRDRLKPVVEKFQQLVGEAPVGEFNAELEKLRASTPRR